ncbi:YqcI/YcgG family protein [Bacillus sp. B-jedd]|uniref:YqcI/YcgG family protein n=1 Tax=Bacillus sp. B-jedd TaxID=1476857 RepID=UPI0005156A6C|nr:YqcI/YcgG family protein [Bacillus sp. B-jedd]CEG27051.1 Hypothetical protein BN1002_01907 [Bacillus sp. B-jedd]
MVLYTKEELFQAEIEPWKKDAYEKFDRKMTDVEKPFPCIPATLGHRFNHFRYGFLPAPTDSGSSRELALALEEFSTIYQTTGLYASLVLFYEKSVDELTVEDYEQVFWEQLGRVCHFDKIEWPAHIPLDPEDSLWEFCFHGEQYFVYCATPAHRNRQSRYFPYLMLAITPRSVLVELNKSPERAAKLKTQIRKRLENYDSVPPHPDLNAYGQEDNFEWKQYYLRDDESTAGKCPFHHFLKEREDNNG